MKKNKTPNPKLCAVAGIAVTRFIPAPGAELVALPARFSEPLQNALRKYLLPKSALCLIRTASLNHMSGLGLLPTAATVLSRAGECPWGVHAPRLSRAHLHSSVVGIHRYSGGVVSQCKSVPELLCFCSYLSIVLQYVISFIHLL